MIRLYAAALLCAVTGCASPYTGKWVDVSAPSQVLRIDPDGKAASGERSDPSSAVQWKKLGKWDTDTEDKIRLTWNPGDYQVAKRVGDSLVVSQPSTDAGRTTYERQR